MANWDAMLCFILLALNGLSQCSSLAKSDLSLSATSSCNVPSTVLTNSSFIEYPDLRHFTWDYREEDFVTFRFPLLVTRDMLRVRQFLAAEVQLKVIIKGPFGVGKSSTLRYLAYEARKEGWLVFPISGHAFADSSAVSQGFIKGVLKNWKDVTGTKRLSQIKCPSNQTMTFLDLLDIAERDSSKLYQVFRRLISELKNLEDCDVLFIIDQANKLGKWTSSTDEELQAVDEREIDASALVGFLAAALMRENSCLSCLRCNIAYASTGSAFPFPVLRKSSGAEQFHLQPLAKPLFTTLALRLKQEGALKLTDDIDFLYNMCGGLPRELGWFVQFSVDKFKMASSERPVEVYLAERSRHFEQFFEQFLTGDYGDRVRNETLVAFGDLLGEAREVRFPPVWREIGLVVYNFTQGGEQFSCAAVQTAAVRVMKDSTRELMEALLPQRVGKFFKPLRNYVISVLLGIPGGKSNSIVRGFVKVGIQLVFFGGAMAWFWKIRESCIPTFGWIAALTANPPPSPPASATPSPPPATAIPPPPPVTAAPPPPAARVWKVLPWAALATLMYKFARSLIAGH